MAADNILNGNTRSVDYSVIPTAVFTIPNVASVDLTEKQAEEKGLEFRIKRGVTNGWPSSKRIGEKHSAYKILISNEDDTIIGAHLARHNASEVINIFGLAMKYRIPASELVLLRLDARPPVARGVHHHLELVQLLLQSRFPVRVEAPPRATCPN